jgi:hypothetical protein
MLIVIGVTVIGSAFCNTPRHLRQRPISGFAAQKTSKMFNLKIMTQN